MPARHLLPIIGLLALCVMSGCENRRHHSYMRSPLVRELKLKPGPVAAPEVSTPADPYPPPRPVLPDEPSSFASVPMIQSPERTRAP